MIENEYGVITFLFGKFWLIQILNTTIPLLIHTISKHQNIIIKIISVQTHKIPQNIEEKT